MEDLKPCPFCGQAAARADHDAYQNWYVICESCGCQTSGDHDQWGAQTAWNLRANDA